MEGVVERRHREARAQIPGYTIAGKTGTAAKLVNGHYSHCRLQRVVRRLRAVAQSGGRDHRRHRLAARAERRPRRHGLGADLQAHRRGDAALSRRRADDQPGAAGAGRAPRRTGRRARRADADGESAPVVSLVADGPPGTVPDLARHERARSGAQARQARPDGARVAATASSCRRIRARRADRRRARSAAWCSSARARRDRGRERSHDLGRAARRAARPRPDSGRRRAAGRSRGRRGDAASPTTRAPCSPATCSSRSKASTPTAPRSRARRSSAAPPRSSPSSRAPEGVHVPWAMVDGRAARARGAGRGRSTAIRAARCGSSASPAPTARRRRRICSRRSSRPPAFRCGVLGTVALPHRRRGARGDAHDARSAGRAGAAARDGRSRLRRLRDGSVVARAVAAPRRRHDVRRRRLHQPDARSSRLPRRHGGVLPGQAPAVRDAAARRAEPDQPRRSARRRRWSTPAAGR